MDQMKDFLIRTQNDLLVILKTAEKSIEDETKRIITKISIDEQAIKKEINSMVKDFKGNKGKIKKYRKDIDKELKNLKKDAVKELKKISVKQRGKMTELQKEVIKSFDNLYSLYVEEEAKSPIMLKEYILQPNDIMAEHLQNSVDFMKDKFDNICKTICSKVREIYDEFYTNVQMIAEENQNIYVNIFDIIDIIQTFLFNEL